MDATLFGDDAVPQVLFFFSGVNQIFSSSGKTTRKKRKSRITRYAEHFPSSSPSNAIQVKPSNPVIPCSSFETRLLQCASLSLSSSSSSSSSSGSGIKIEAPENVDPTPPPPLPEKIFDKRKFSSQARELMKNLSTLERAAIGAAAGGIAGAFTYTCLHPLDTIKTKLQAKGGAEAYKNSFDVAVKVLQQQGIAGFYSGISAAMIGSTISSAIYFGTCELAKSLLSRASSLPPLLIPPVAGASGNIISSAILVPKEVITQRMQAGAKGRSWSVLVKILERDGVRGLYVGYSAALLRNLPSGVISFSTFEYLRWAWLRLSGNDSLEPWQSVSSGALAGAIAAGLTTPMDVVKTRLMTQGVRGGGSSAALTYQGVVETLQRIWVEEGWAGVTRGIGPRLLHSACFSAIGFFAFETARVEILKRHLASKGIEPLAQEQKQV